MSSFNLAPLLYKRLRIEGSTLRSRSKEYQADLIKRQVYLAYKLSRPIDYTMTTHTDPMQASATKPPAGSKRPGPRKRKTLLSSLPDPGTQKAKKLTILDKSAMDWKSHVSDAAGAATSASLSDELEANRRGGGYLEKVEFLQRVEERREEVLERGKAQGKRRRG